MLDVVGAIINRDGNYLIARRSSNNSYAGKWEFPGGKVEKGETNEEALIREIDEELNLKIKSLKFCKTLTDKKIRLNMFYVQVDHIERMVLREHDEIQWVPLDQLKIYDYTPLDEKFIADLF